MGMVLGISLGLGFNSAGVEASSYLLLGLRVSSGSSSLAF